MARIVSASPWASLARIGVWGRHDESLDHVIRRSPALDYWEGERR